MTTITPIASERASVLTDPVQLLLLTTDGTLTDLLEALNGEKLCAVLLKQEIAPAETNIDALTLASGEPLLVREVVLRGQRSGTVYVHAESRIAIERLDDRIRRGLLTTNIPLGHLWKNNRVETFKEVLGSGIEPSGQLSVHFGISPQTPLLLRSCRVSCGGKPVTLITEHVRRIITQPRGSWLAFMTTNTLHGAAFSEKTFLLATARVSQPAN
jgi:chorismate-pyruvate lyase